MLNRRFLRIKVLQALYGYFSRNDGELRLGEKEMMKSIERMYDLYFFMLDLLINLHKHAERKIEEGKEKKLPTAEDLNPNMKFVENTLLVKLSTDDAFIQEVEAHSPGWADQRDLVRSIYRELIESDVYERYMRNPERSFAEDQELLVWIYSEIIAPREFIHELLEETSMYWADDLALANSTVLKTIRSPKKLEKFKPSPLYKDEEDRDFAVKLFRLTILHSDEFIELIAKRAVNWESERIAQMDLTLMKMALCEFMYFETVPTKVTMNEYIELSKDYSTPRSKTFINGILDKLLTELQKAGKVKKIGRGLIG